MLDAALHHAGDSKVFAAYLHSASSGEIAALRLGKKTEQLYAEAEKLHRQLDQYWGFLRFSRSSQYRHSIGGADGPLH